MSTIQKILALVPCECAATQERADRDQNYGISPRHSAVNATLNQVHMPKKPLKYLFVGAHSDQSRKQRGAKAKAKVRSTKAVFLTGALISESFRLSDEILMS
jgi:hypothetical protein